MTTESKEICSTAFMLSLYVFFIKDVRKKAYKHVHFCFSCEKSFGFYHLNLHQYIKMKLIMVYLNVRVEKTESIGENEAQAKTKP